MENTPRAAAALYPGAVAAAATAAAVIGLKFHPKHATNKNKTKHIMKILHINVNIYDKLQQVNTIHVHHFGIGPFPMEYILFASRKSLSSHAPNIVIGDKTITWSPTYVR